MKGSSLKIAKKNKKIARNPNLALEIVPGDTEAGLGDVALDDLGRAQCEERLLFICYHGMMSLGEKETIKSD